MSAEREENGDAANDMHYPSPSAEGMDAGPFYHNATARDDMPEHQNDPEQQVAEHIAEPPQEKEQDHNEMHQTEPTTPQQHNNSRPPNIEELQLAAQLGQGLAGTPMIPTTDPNMNVEDPNLRSIMPHPEPDAQQQPQAYMHDTPTSDSMMTHGLPVSVGAQLPPHYAMTDNIPPRKRSKVSRACDECRRKKIKCDAPSDTGDTPCSSCARINVRCLFSRVPQKRGPSKGYIKELADRIAGIENKLDSDGGLTQEDLSGLFGERSRTSNAGDESRKRPYSSISGGEFESPSTARQTPWAPDQPRPIQPAIGDSTAAPYTSASLAPEPTAVKTNDLPQKSPVPHVEANIPESGEVPDVDDGVLQDYHVTLQALYPIMPHTIDRVQSLLMQCPPAVSIAFVNALLAVAQSSSGNVKLANSLLNTWESDESPRSLATNIVHAQTLLLLAIDADWRGSQTVSSLLGRAVVLANSMSLWKLASMTPSPESGEDSDESLCTRIWWSLVLMDRWHAAGSGKPVMIPDSSVVIPRNLQSVVGESCYYLLRLSKALKTISQIIQNLPDGSTATDVTTASMLGGYIETFREDLPEHIEPATYPLVHLGYWHCRLIAYLLTPEVIPEEILWPTKELINLLTTNADMRSPLANHFGSLVSLALSRLSKFDSAREEAVQLTKEILDKPGIVWDGIRDKLTEQMRPTSSSGDAASLQHLADLATATQGPGAEDNSSAPSLAQGYLTVG